MSLRDKWQSLKSRCLNPNNRRFSIYGKRGITYDPSWEIFENFELWALASGYMPGLSIERIDVNGNYCPDNCTWIPRINQARNRRDTVLWEYDGEKLTVPEWSEKYNISKKNLYQRLARGWSMKEALNVPLGSHKTIGRRPSTSEGKSFKYLNSVKTPNRKNNVYITCFGTTKKLSEWSLIFDLEPTTIRYRIKKLGWAVGRAISEPADYSKKRKYV
jgi:hypothetical protein